jgi:hypothetical protein
MDINLQNLTIEQLRRECEFYIEALPVQLELLQERAELHNNTELLQELRANSNRIRDTTMEMEERLGELLEEYSGNTLKNHLVQLLTALLIDYDNIRKRL